MGGFISLIIAMLAVVTFALSGRPAGAIVAGVVAVVCLWSWLHMRYFARIVARDRLFVAALERSDFQEDSPEAPRHWREMLVHVEPCDVAGIPNWIATVNMVASITAVVLLIVGAISYQSRTHAGGALIAAATIIGVGLVLFFAVGNLIDALVFHLAVGAGDPITNILVDAPNPRRRFVLNILRPTILAIIIFGGGLGSAAVLGLSTWGSVGAGLWFFFLTQIACLSGRRASLNEAGWVMVVTIILLVGAFIALQSAR